MGAKIKKEAPKKTIISTEEKLFCKYTLAVPCMGLILMAVMGTYAGSPLLAGNTKAIAIFVGLAAIGVLFAFNMYLWRLIADQRGLTRHGVLLGEKSIPYDHIKCVEVKKYNEDVIYYNIIAKNGRKFMRVTALVVSYNVLLERLKKLGIKVVEI